MMQTLYNTYSSWRIATCSMQLYSVSESIKGSAGVGLSLSQLHHIVEATSPVRNKKEEQDSDHSIYCEYKDILHFPAIRTAVHCLYD